MRVSRGDTVEHPRQSVCGCMLQATNTSNIQRRPISQTFYMRFNSQSQLATCLSIYQPDNIYTHVYNCTRQTFAHNEQNALAVDAGILVALSRNRVVVVVRRTREYTIVPAATRSPLARHGRGSRHARVSSLIAESVTS